MARYSASILRKKGSKRLYVAFTYFGHRIREATGVVDTPENEEAVRAWLKNQLEKVRIGTFRFASAFPHASEQRKAFFSRLEARNISDDPADVLIGRYIERKWLPRWRARKHSDTVTEAYEGAIAFHILPWFRQISFRDLTGEALVDFIAGLVHRSGKKKGQQLSGRRIRNVLTPLRAIWRAAVVDHHWEFLLPDPFEYLQNADGSENEDVLPPRGQNKPEVLRFDQWSAIYENMNAWYRPITKLMLMTGMIHSEIAGLRWDHVGPRYIEVRYSWSRKRERDGLKTQSRRRKIRITNAIQEVLNELRARASGPYVATTHNGKRFNGGRFRERYWNPALKLAKVPARVPYVLRHTFAAWALTIGKLNIALVKLMGHSSKQMVFDVYGDYVEELEADKPLILAMFGEDFI